MTWCRVCLTSPALFGWFDPAKSINERVHEWFCSREHREKWMSDKPGLALDEVKAMEASLPDVGRHVADSGIDGKRFADLSRDEALGLIRACVQAYQARMREVAPPGSPPF